MANPVEGQQGIGPNGEKLIFSSEHGGFVSPEDYAMIKNVAEKGHLMGGIDNAVNALKGTSKEALGGIGGGTLASLFMAPETGGASLGVPILGALLGGAIGNTYDQPKKQDGTVEDPLDALMGGVRQGGWETAGQALRLPKALGLDERLYRSTGRFNPMAPKGQTEDAVKFGLRNNIILPSGAEKAGIKANEVTNKLVNGATNWRPNVRGQLTAGTEAQLAGRGMPEVQGGKLAVQDAEIAGRAKDIKGAGGVPRVNPQFSGEMRDNIANGVVQPQPIGDELKGAGTIRVNRNPYDNPGLGAPVGMVDPRRVVNTGLPDFAKELNQRGHNQTALSNLQDLINQFYTEKGSKPLTYEDLNALRQREQNLGKSFYNAEGKIADPSNDIRAGYHAGMGSGASQVLKHDLPQTAQSLKDVQDSIYLQRGITPTSAQAKGSVPGINALGSPMRGLLGPGTFALAHYGTGMGVIPSALAGIGLWGATSPEALRAMAIGVNKGSRVLPAAARAAHSAEAIALQDALNGQ